MKIPLTLLALLAACGLARADIVIVQKVESAGQSGQLTVKVNGDKVRADISPQVSTITDGATGDVTTLMHDQKVYMVMSAAAGKVMLDQMTKIMQQSNPKASGTTAAAAPAATGKTEKINGYNAAEYTFNNGIVKATYWMSTDYPNAKAVNDALAKFRKGSLADLTRPFAPDPSLLPGVPLKTEMLFNGQRLSTELVSATESAVDASEYQVPQDYTLMKMPAMPQQ